MPERPWASVLMHFLSGFPKVEEKGVDRVVIVVVDRFSEYAIFITTGILRVWL
jgi:hypothetical protein